MDAVVVISAAAAAVGAADSVCVTPIYSLWDQHAECALALILAGGQDSQRDEVFANFGGNSSRGGGGGGGGRECYACG